MNNATMPTTPTAPTRMRGTTVAVAGAVVALALFAGGYTLGANGAVGRSATATSGATDATAGSGARAGAGAGAAVRPGAGGGQGGGGINPPINGRIISVNADSITIALTAPRAPGQAGQPSASPVVTSSIVLVGGGARVLRTTETDLKLSDLKANDQVTIIGQTDATTGTVSAQTVVVGGAGIFGGLFGSGQGGQGGQAGQGGQGGSGGQGGPRPSASPAR